jgi:hypothetical protein
VGHPPSGILGYNFRMTEDKMAEKKDKAREVFDLAEEKTLDSQLEWTATDTVGVFTASTTSGFMLRMYPYTSYDDAEPTGPPSLTLLDSALNLVFDITNQVIETKRLNRLYEQVKRRAEGTDEKLQLIIDDLKKLG